MATDRQIGLYRLLGATEGESEALESLPPPEASPLIQEKIDAKIAALVAGARIKIRNRCATVLSQYSVRGEKQVRVRWEDQQRPQSYEIAYFFGATIEGKDEAVAETDAWEKRVFGILESVRDEYGDAMPNIHNLAVQKRLLTAVASVRRPETTAEEIADALRAYIEKKNKGKAKRMRKF